MEDSDFSLLVEFSGQEYVNTAKRFQDLIIAEDPEHLAAMQTVASELEGIAVTPLPSKTPEEVEATVARYRKVADELTRFTGIYHSPYGYRASARRCMSAGGAVVRLTAEGVKDGLPNTTPFYAALRARTEHS